MPKLRVQSFAISIDGFAAGPNQSLENPLGIGGLALHEWAFPTQTFQQMFGNPEGTTGIDDDFVARGFSNIGAWILGRNMFGPIRGPWPDDDWKGWWGDNPPYHTPVFVLTHHARESITMEGGTTFHFITDGIHRALERAIEAANGQDVRLGGGVARSSNICEQGWWMKCISPSPQLFWVPGKGYSATLICQHWAINVSNMSPHKMQRMWF